jgi:hypothetical protein
MTLVAIPGPGLWVPFSPIALAASTSRGLIDSLTLDADEEEAQQIATVTIDGGGSKTFGTAGSSIAWLPGGGITFAAGSTVRVGVKQAAAIDTANGPPARAAIGAAAFDVYKDVVGGTDTLTSTTWRTDAMAAGTPFTVTDGDLLAVCWHLDVASGTPSVKVRGMAAAITFPMATLVTSGPTYTATTGLPNVILTFDDGTIGWLEPTVVFAVGDTPGAGIGNTNIHGNIMRFPFPCAVDMVATTINTVANTADFAVDLYRTPLGTPVQMATTTFDANVTVLIGSRVAYKRFAVPQVLEADTDYALGLRQTQGVSNVNFFYYEVANTAHWKANTFGPNIYAAHSTAGGTFAVQQSGRRRYLIWARISHLDDGVSPGGGGSRGILTGGRL